MNIDKQREIRKFIYNRFPYDNNWLDGNCYYFAVILKARYPEAIIVYDVANGHFLVKIEDIYFDWVGDHDFSEEIKKYFIEWEKFDEYDPLQKQRIIRDCIL